jgi:transporter family-2 protein
MCKRDTKKKGAEIMTLFQQPIFYGLLMCAAGIGIPVMAALNAGLGTKLNSPALATSILFMVGGTVSLIYLLITGIPRSANQAPIPILFFSGGLFVIFYILSITWVGPKFGIGNAVCLVLLGQLISTSVIDHYGFFGAIRYSMSTTRLIGLTLMILGVFLTVRRF